MKKGNAIALLPIGVFLCIYLGIGILFEYVMKIPMGFYNVPIIIAFLAAGLIGGFYLARESIQTGYTGALMCWTVVFTPIGTAASLVLGKIVTKSTIENCGADGEGIKYAAAKAAGFTTANQEGSEESPAI